MRLFQNFGLYRTYLKRLDSLCAEGCSFRERVGVFLNDRFGATHLLKPVLEQSPDSFFANGNDAIGQAAWAKEHGLPAKSTLSEILLAQVEHHKTEVFYNLDPVTYSNSFLKKLPGCVRRTIAWHAAPSPHFEFNEYDFVVNNFPQILASLAKKGFRTAYFFPAFDPVMSEYNELQDRPIDVLFVGSYSHHHSVRCKLLNHIAELSDRFNIQFSLDKSRLVKLAETPFGLLGPLTKYRPPKAIRRISSAPVFGRDLYRTIASAKIILNGAIDMAGNERGNMRCWEAMGCGAMMLSDTGIYPDSMVQNHHFLTYSSICEIAKIIEFALSNDHWKNVAQRGHEMISSFYTKELQWKAFEKIVG